MYFFLCVISSDLFCQKISFNKYVVKKSPETRNKQRRIHYEETKDWKLGVNPVVVMDKLKLGKIKVVKCS